MNKRFFVFIISIVMMFSSTSTVFACDEEQTNYYVPQILFGESAMNKSSDRNVMMLMNALYLCSEQSDNLGKDKIDYLKMTKVSGVPSLSDIDIKSDELIECSHNSWEHEYSVSKKQQSKRKKILQNTVNKVFDFGLFSNWFGSNKGKCSSFASLLYYSHILADYLADDPSETEVNANGKLLRSYMGERSVTMNGGKPQFTKSQKESTKTEIRQGEIDQLGRCGAVYAVLDRKSMEFVGPRPLLPDPVAWKPNKYPDLISRKDLFNRCHLIGRQFCGVDDLHNLITGTSYLNDTMSKFENDIANYLKNNDNHVVYRVTPIYKGNNLLASGVQMEAYSVEDSGAGLSFNEYCYNVQPGIDINYATGDNSVSDTTIGDEKLLPFAISNARDSEPDLMYEMDKHLKILFENQNNSGTYTSMVNDINSIANDARAVGTHGESEAQIYLALKEDEYKYFDALKRYVPKLLEKEDFFTAAFN